MSRWPPDVKIQMSLHLMNLPDLSPTLVIQLATARVVASVQGSQTG